MNDLPDKELDRALERLVDVSLQDELRGDTDSMVDFAEAVADQVVQGGVASRRRGYVSNLLLLAAGLALVATIRWAVDPGTTEDPLEPAPREEAGPQGPEAGDDGTPIRLKSFDELRSLLPSFVRVECRALLAGRVDASNPTPFVTADAWVLREIRETFGGLEKADQAAAHAWPNEIRLYTEEGRYVAFTFSSETRFLSFAGIGDAKYHPGFIKVFSGLVKRARWAADRQYGIVRSPADLRRTGDDGFPEGIEQLSFVGAGRFDLTLLTHFQQLRALEFTGEASRGVQRLDFAPLARMPSLISVSLRHARLGEEQLADLARAPALRELDLQSAVITPSAGDGTGSPFDALRDCPTLEVLRCGSATPMDGRAIDAIQSVSSLRGLDLSGRSLGSVSPLELSGLDALRDLRELRLSQVPIDLAPLLSALQDAGTRIESLDLSDTQLNDRGAGRVAQFRSLQILRAARCVDLTAAGIAAVCTGCPIEVLDLGGCRHLKAKALGKALIGARRTLTELSLEQVPVGDAAVGSLRQLLQLERLDLSFSGVGDTTLTRLVHLSRLQRLELAGCRELSDEGLEAVRKRSVTVGSGESPSIGLGASQFRDLRFLDLSLCAGLSHGAVEAFRRSRPDCVVRASQFD